MNLFFLERKGGVLVFLFSCPLSASERQSGVVLGQGCDGNSRVQGREGTLGNAILALPSPTVFGGNRGSDEAKKGCSTDTEVID